MKDGKLSYVDLLARVGETNRCPGGKRTVRQLARRLGVGPETRVLEIGSNTGFTSIELVKITGCRAVGVDVNESAVAQARETADRLAGGLAQRVTFQVADATDLPFDDGRFDLVVCGGANTFVQERDKALTEYARVLRPYGFLSITNLYYRTEPSPDLLRELNEVLGFDVPVFGLNDWLKVLAPEDWELYELTTTDLVARPVSVVDEYVDALCQANLALIPSSQREAITDQLRHAMHVFNRNHAHLSYMELALRRDEAPEQPELFLTAGRYDPFFENAFVAPGGALTERSMIADAR